MRERLYSTAVPIFQMDVQMGLFLIMIFTNVSNFCCVVFYPTFFSENPMNSVIFHSTDLIPQLALIYQNKLNYTQLNLCDGLMHVMELVYTTMITRDTNIIHCTKLYPDENSTKYYTSKLHLTPAILL